MFDNYGVIENMHKQLSKYKRSMLPISIEP